MNGWFARTVRRRSWPGTDRKSTRLNSSHSQISYAVFCLKKKNIQNSLHTPHVYQAEAPLTITSMLWFYTIHLTLAMIITPHHFLMDFIDARLIHNPFLTT